VGAFKVLRCSGWRANKSLLSAAGSQVAHSEAQALLSIILGMMKASHMIAAYNSASDGDSSVSYVLGVCSRAGDVFTIRKIVRLVLEERPDLKLLLPKIWGMLVKDKRVVFVHDGNERHYEVAQELPKSRGRAP
jgi:hypothetical protein